MTALTVLAFVLSLIWAIIYSIAIIIHSVWWLAEIDGTDAPPWRKHATLMVCNISAVAILWWLVWYLSHFTG
jgi:uncharacterized membrane protein